jgi:hypothetical protein
MICFAPLVYAGKHLSRAERDPPAFVIARSKATKQSILPVAVIPGRE